MALDENFTDRNYILGRIFSVLEKLSIHHLSKLEKGAKIYFEKQLTNLMGINDKYV